MNLIFSLAAICRMIYFLMMLARSIQPKLPVRHGITSVSN